MAEPAVKADKELFTIEPWDEHNQKTVANVHPNDWVNPEPAARYWSWALERPGSSPRSAPPVSARRWRSVRKI